MPNDPRRNPTNALRVRITISSSNNKAWILCLRLALRQTVKPFVVLVSR